MYGSFEDGISKLPSLLEWINQKDSGVHMLIQTLSEGGAYECSVLIFSTVIEAITTVEDAASFFASDFSHQYTSFGGYGNLWALVSVDPDG
jgi:hypothetical protein